MKRLEAEFLEAHDKAQDYLGNCKDELWSLAAGTSENTHQHWFKESIVRKSVEKQRWKPR